MQTEELAIKEERIPIFSVAQERGAATTYFANQRNVFLSTLAELYIDLLYVHCLRLH